MKKDVSILIIDKKKEHFESINKGLLRAGLSNKMLHFASGQGIVDFLFEANTVSQKDRESKKYILLLDICVPKIDGIEVLRKIKTDATLKIIPVIILTSKDDLDTIALCYKLGASTCIIRPKETIDLIDTAQKIGRFFSAIELAPI